MACITGIDPKRQVGGQLDDIVVADLDPAVRRQQERDHQGVLLADAGAQLGQHAGRHAQVQGDGIGVPAARAAAGHDQQLVLRARCHDLLQQRQDHRPAAVDDALPAQLDDVQLGQRAEDLLGLGACQQGFIHQ